MYIQYSYLLPPKSIYFGCVEEADGIFPIGGREPIVNLCIQVRNGFRKAAILKRLAHDYEKASTFQPF